MRVVLTGVNHKTAPVEVRERLSIPECRLAEATRALASYPGIAEALVLSTCNRTELLARPTNGAADLSGFLRSYLHVEPHDFAPFLYRFEGREAMRHFF